MDNKDKDLKKALDDIFGSDFIEIDVKEKKEKENKQDAFLFFTDDSQEDFNKKAIKEVPKKDENNNLNVDSTSSVSLSNNLKELTNLSDNKDDINKQNKNEEFIIPKEKDSNKIIPNKTQQAPNIPDVIKENNEDKKKKHGNKNPFSSKKIIIWFIVCFLIGITLIYLIVNFGFGVEKVMNCHQSAKDVGYEYTDEYKITYKKNEILYIESSYTYNALNDEYKNQIEFIKNERLPVVINTNGMDGFTYVYEVSDDSFKVNGYLDFSLFNFNEIDKINQDLMPISYFKFDSKTTYKSLISNFEKEGYECIPSK